MGGGCPPSAEANLRAFPSQDLCIVGVNPVERAELPSAVILEGSVTYAGRGRYKI